MKYYIFKNGENLQYLSNKFLREEGQVSWGGGGCISQFFHVLVTDLLSDDCYQLTRDQNLKSKDRADIRY